MRPGEKILFPQLDYAIKLSSEVELQIEKMEDQDILIFSTMMHLVQQNKRQIKLSIGMNRNINSNCFSVALAPLYHSCIAQLNLVLFE